jgi:hypothetical protein
MVFNTPGGKAENVIYFAGPADYDGPSLTALAQAVEDSWELNVAPLVSNEITLFETVATDVSSSTGPQATDPGGINGAVVNAALPQNVTIAVSFRTGKRGRSYRGRLYHVGLCENQVSGDEISEAFSITLRTAYENFFEDVATTMGDGTHHVVVSRCQDGVWLSTAEVTDVEAYVVETTIDSMRRRLLGRGR